MFNRAHCLTGFKASQVKGTDFTEFFHPADNKKSINCLKLCTSFILFALCDVNCDVIVPICGHAWLFAHDSVYCLSVWGLVIG